MIKNAREKICLISPPTRSNVQVIPIALVYLAAWLEKEGIDTEIIDIKISPFKSPDSITEEKIIQKTVRRISESRTSFVGITCFTSEYNSVMRLAQAIKRHMNVKIVIGGVHSTLRPEDFIYEGSPVDIAVIGEGEETITELVRQYADQALLKNINGIAFLENGIMRMTPARSLIEDLARLPLPSYDKLDMDYYLTMTKYIIRYIFTSGAHILTSRGCPFLCTFCAVKNLWKTPDNKVKVRHKSVSQIIDEIQYLRGKYSMDSFYIADDTFAMGKDRAIEFCDEILKRDIKIIWAMETRVNLVNDTLLKAIKKAGCIQVEFGVESGSQEALDRMKKGIRVEDTVRAFELCKKYGLRTFANLMLNTPGETEKDVSETFCLKNRIKASHAGVNLTMPIIGTDIYEQYVNPKISKDEYVLFEDAHFYTKILDPRFRLAKHKLNLNRLYYLANIYNYLNPFFEFTLNLRYLRSIFASKRKWQLVPCIMSSFLKQIRAYLRFLGNIFLRIFNR